MKKIIIFFLMMVFIIVGIPFFIIQKTETKKEPLKLPETIKVYIKSSDKVVTMNINQYLKEVVSAEMPADFHEEALKAQAIAARTYLYNRIKNGDASQKEQIHKGADICTDSKHCKAWISEKERKKLWDKSKRKSNWEKISNAVDSTKNLIITYNNEPISAVFHSTSSGRTENSKDVWGGDPGYLKSVESIGDLQSPKYLSTKTYTLDEFKNIAKKNIKNVCFDKYIIGNIQRSEAGGITYIDIGGVKIKGTQMRSIFDLRSANSEFKIENNTVTITSKGFGHGVGMSQYGANYLACQGKNYEEIIKTYYTGVSISECKEYKKEAAEK